MSPSAHGLLLAAAAASAVLLAAGPRPLPRRFPEDDDVPDPPTRARSPLRLGRRAPSSAPPSDLAECCDLLAVATASGLNVADAVRVVGAVGVGPVGGLLSRVSHDVDDGVLLSDALGRARVGAADEVRPLLSTLAGAAVSGAPAGPSLQRLADAERRRARRRVEARVRRLPVLLLVPLVGLVLPAFVLLTLVPVGLATAAGAGITTGAP